MGMSQDSTYLADLLKLKTYIKLTQLLGEYRSNKMYTKEMKVDSGSRQNWIPMPALISTKLHNLRSIMELV